MFHPLLTVLVRKPELVLEHLAGYGALVHEEVAEVGLQLATRAAAWGAMAIMALVFVLLTGVSIMLGCVTHTFHWALVVVPLVFLAATVGCFVYARTPMTATRFGGLKAQLDADVQAMRIAGERK